MSDEKSGRDVLLAVQTVLFETTALAVQRMLASLDQAAATVRRTNSSIVVVVRIGDCTEPQVSESEEYRAARDGLRHIELQYQRLNQGVSRQEAHNILATDTDEDYVLTLEPGALVDSHSLQLLLQVINGDNVGVVDGKTLPLPENKPFDCGTGETPWCSTAFSLFRSEVFRDVGGLGHNSPSGLVSDVDLSLTIRQNGWKLLHQPASVVFLDRRLDNGVIGPISHQNPGSVAGKDQ